MFMDRWHAFGNLIGSKMPLIVPCCVAAGVLLPQVFSPIRTVVPVMFAFMTFQGSLNNTVHQLVGVFKHPKDLIVILLISQVFMPTLAYFLASLLFAGNVNLITGILLEYSVPVAVVSFMWVGMFHGDGPLGLAVILVSTVLAPFSIPLTLQILMGHSIQIDAAKMIFDMVLMIALPALAGMMVNELTHGWGHERLSPAISPACRALLVIIITANSTAMSSYVLHMTWGRVAVALFIFVYACSGYVWGMLVARLLHQPQPALITMSFTCGLRNISSGAVIASQYFPGEVVFPVMCGTLFQQMLAAFFGALIHRLYDEDAPAVNIGEANENDAATSSVRVK